MSHLFSTVCHPLGLCTYPTIPFIVSTSFLAARDSLLALDAKFCMIRMSSCTCLMSVLIAPKAYWRLLMSQSKPIIVANIDLNSCVSTSTGGGGLYGISTSSASYPGTVCDAHYPSFLGVFPSLYPWPPMWCV